MIGDKIRSYCAGCNGELDSEDIALYDACEFCGLSCCSECIDLVSDSVTRCHRHICTGCFDPKIHTVIDDERG